MKIGEGISHRRRIIWRDMDRTFETNLSSTPFIGKEEVNNSMLLIVKYKNSLGIRDKIMINFNRLFSVRIMMSERKKISYENR